MFSCWNSYMIKNSHVCPLLYLHPLLSLSQTSYPPSSNLLFFRPLGKWSINLLLLGPLLIVVTSCLRTREYALSAFTFLVRNRMGRARKNKIWKERKLFKSTSLSWLPLREVGLQLHKVPSDEPCKISLSITYLGRKRTFALATLSFPFVKDCPGRINTS